MKGFKSPHGPHVSLPGIGKPSAPHMSAFHPAKQFQQAHPDNTLDANLTDMFEVQKHQKAQVKAEQEEV
jgi:hypothetical protein